MKKYYRTDLACESFLPEKSKNGVITNLFSTNGIDVIKTVIENEFGEKLTKRKIGTYLTVYSGRAWLFNDYEKQKIAHVVAENLKSLLSLIEAPPKNILIVGLGNRFITADALGALCIDKLTATRHLKYENKKSNNPFKYEISLIAPGVSGQTGIESYEIVNNIATVVKANCIIVIDSLASRSMDRLCTTIQISNTGIYPGSGIGNIKKEISKSTTGVDVLSIGIPTVIDSSSLICSALEAMEIKKMPKELKELLNNGKGCFVSLKDTDIIIESMSEIISSAISIAFSNNNLQ